LRNAAFPFALLVLTIFGPAGAAELTLEAVNSASFSESDNRTSPGTRDPFTIRLQVLLDRAHVSAGSIDGIRGENLNKAVRSFEELRGLPADGEIDEEAWAALEQDDGKVLEVYEISDGDLAARYLEVIPEDYSEMAQMDWLGFRGPREMLAERFHMDESLLEALNPDADFTKPGTAIVVAAVGGNAEANVSKIVIDRSGGRLLAYGTTDKLEAAYPATIGSAENPTPSGSHTVKAVVTEPTYSYNPDLNFQQGKNAEPLEIPAGPNGPVGLVWIDLSKPTYGIHGTPDPDLVGKAPSHGCVRLTNWDALELAELVRRGVTVEFQ